MSFTKRKRGKSLHLDLSSGAFDEKPSIAALFLVQFDVKAGYTIAWKRAVTGCKWLVATGLSDPETRLVEITESVEFKSLPSGLHHVDEDLIYFMHDDDHIGISAFVNRVSKERARNALMLAVGALLPLSHGRLGRSWKLADALGELSKKLIEKPDETKPLEDFWRSNRLQEEQTPGGVSESPFTVATKTSRHQTPMTSPNGNGSGPRQRSRATSGGSAMAALGPVLSPHHPAMSLPVLLDTFGPLIYPLYKAALLRKRILIVTPTPIELACNYVYDISVISSIPTTISSHLPLEPLPTRLEPLFSIGVHDIDSLSDKQKAAASDSSDPNYGWIACTTDDVLSTKSSLYDILITLPPKHAKKAKEKAWPKLQTSFNISSTSKPQTSSNKQEIKASQRDLRRYRTLRQALRNSSSSRPRTRASFGAPSRENRFSEQSEDSAHHDQSPLLPQIQNTHETFDDASSTIDEKLIEPLSWSALAYASFMWWASAGEKSAERDSEEELDASLWRDFGEYMSLSPNVMWGDDEEGDERGRSESDDGGNVRGGVGGPEMAIIGYFHRLTTCILGTLGEVVDVWDAEGENGGEEGEGRSDTVVVGSEDITRMGLDPWSEADRKFVGELVELYWGRQAEVRGGRVDCCGVRIL